MDGWSGGLSAICDALFVTLRRGFLTHYGLRVTNLFSVFLRAHFAVQPSQPVLHNGAEHLGHVYAGRRSYSAPQFLHKTFSVVTPTV